ncbi:MAG: 4Fe-4S binding protein [Candidatus Cloacimonetes bacterium]|nr:4Fe-4S binding protein [Candidatus Cloacimonadota bacterium]
MKEIVIISGKGGTGKTSVAAALAFVAEKSLMADCDVDAADMHLILKPDHKQAQDFYSGLKAEIDPAKCSFCGLCKEVCRFNAIQIKHGVFEVDFLACEGCGYCFEVCPVGAISLPQQNVGQSFISNTKLGASLVHARLGIGADNSGKLVAKVKKDAKRIAGEDGLEYVLVDGSPGIGCPVISSLSGANLVVFVTEPSLSGLSDLKRVWELTKRFGIHGVCVINKADLNSGVSSQIREFLGREGIGVIAEIPYDEDFSRAITQGQSLVEYDPQKWKPIFAKIWEQIKKELS